jgi:hypothetical protein
MSTFEARVAAQNSLDLLEQSEHDSELVGKHPAEVPSEILQRHYREQNPVRAIRARCLDCCCGQLSEVRKCVAVDCASWPFRMGLNPFRSKRALSPKQLKVLSDRAAAIRIAGDDY